MPDENNEINKPKEGEANEPETEYVTQQKLGNIYKTISISSMEEMEKDNYRHWLSLTPEQRLAEHYYLITHIYKDELEKSKGTLYDRIYFHE